LAHLCRRCARFKHTKGPPNVGICSDAADDRTDNWEIVEINAPIGESCSYSNKGEDVEDATVFHPAQSNGLLIVTRSPENGDDNGKNRKCDRCIEDRVLNQPSCKRSNGDTGKKPEHDTFGAHV